MHLSFVPVDFPVKDILKKCSRWDWICIHVRLQEKVKWKRKKIRNAVFQQRELRFRKSSPFRKLLLFLQIIVSLLDTRNWHISIKSLEFFLNVFTEFSEFSDSDKNNIIWKGYCCARTCYLLCKELALYLSATRILVQRRHKKYSNPFLSKVLNLFLSSPYFGLDLNQTQPLPTADWIVHKPFSTLSLFILFDVLWFMAYSHCMGPGQGQGQGMGPAQ